MKKSENQLKKYHLEIENINDYDISELKELIKKIVGISNFKIDQLYLALNQQKETYDILSTVVDKQNKIIERITKHEKVIGNLTEIATEQSETNETLKRLIENV